MITTTPSRTVGDIVALMINRRIHRVVIKGEPFKIIDYRNLKSMFENRNYFTKTVKSFFELPIKNLTKNVVRINSSSQIQDLSRLSNEGVDCFVTEKNRMITSWDIVMTAHNILQASQ